MERDRESGLTPFFFILLFVVIVLGALLGLGSYFSKGHRIDVSMAMPMFTSQDVQLASAIDGQPGGANCPGFAEMEQSVKMGVADAVVKEIAPAAYMPLFNALPPATQLSVPQRLLTAESPSLPTVLLLGFGADGCQMMRATIPKQQHHDLLKKMEASI